MNRNLIFTVSVLAFLFVITQTAAAQPRGRMSVKDRVAELKDCLSLTNNQVKKITVILDSADIQRKELFDQSDGDRDVMREKMISLMQETDVKIENLLTKEQKEKYSVMKKERRQQMGQPPGGRRKRGE
jgi:hypothetical protein